MGVRIYRDNEAGSVVFDPSTILPKFTNSLQAVVTDDDTIDIFLIHGPIGQKEVSSISFTEVLKEDGTSAGANVNEVVDYLNSEFNALTGGGPGGNKPTITSSLTESVVAGDPFNYQITATESPIYFDASGLPAGLAVNNEQGGIFGSTTVVGAAVVPITAVNSNGTTTVNLTLTVLAAGPGFVNTRSIRTLGSVYKQYIDMATTAALERDSADAWSVSQWIYIKDLVASDLWSFGTTQINNIAISLAATGEVVVRFTDSNSTALEIEAGTLVVDTWYHLVVTNDGTETPAGIKVYVDGALQANVTNQNNLGGSAGGSGNMRIVRAAGGQGFASYYDGYFDEWSYWDVALTAGNVTSLFNGGVPTDLNAEAFVASLQCWYRTGDADVFPTLTDNEAGGLHDGVMQNMTILNFTNFVP